MLKWVAMSSAQDLHTPGIEPRSPLQAHSLPCKPPEKPIAVFEIPLLWYLPMLWVRKPAAHSPLQPESRQGQGLEGWSVREGCEGPAVGAPSGSGHCSHSPQLRSGLSGLPGDSENWRLTASDKFFCSLHRPERILLFVAEGSDWCFMTETKYKRPAEKS